MALNYPVTFVIPSTVEVLMSKVKIEVWIRTKWFIVKTKIHLQLKPGACPQDNCYNDWHDVRAVDNAVISTIITIIETLYVVVTQVVMVTTEKVIIIKTWHFLCLVAGFLAASGPGGPFVLVMFNCSLLSLKPDKDRISYMYVLTDCLICWNFRCRPHKYRQDPR